MAERSARLLISFALAITTQLLTCEGFYEKGSNVITLTQKNWKKEVVDSDYLSVVEFYREGCGYCQLLTPEYEKVADHFKHMVKVGAVDTEEERNLAGSHGDDANPISGVPTIKLFKPSKSPSGKSEVVIYNGERKASAMAAFVAHHMPSLVRRITAANFDKLFEPHTAVALLFTDKTATTPLFKALSIAYKNRIILGEVNSMRERSLMARFNITEVPTLLAITIGGDGPGDIFTGTIGYKSIDMFLWKFENKLKKLDKNAKETAEDEL